MFSLLRLKIPFFAFELQFDQLRQPGIEVSVRCQAHAHARITLVSVLCIPVPECINHFYLVSVLYY